MRLDSTWLRAALVLLAALALWLAYSQLGLDSRLSLEQLKASRDGLIDWQAQQPLQAALAYFGLYVMVAALSIPGAAVLTLAGGAVFGLAAGVLLVSFASSVGALLAFWVARYLLRDLVQRRLGRWMAPVNAGLDKDGTFYLLGLRLVPVFPFWLINLLMGLTTVGALRYYLVSQLGMLPATVVYVNAGTQLGAVSAVSDVLSPALLGSLVLLAGFPWLARALLQAWRRRQLYARWPRPACFDRNLVVIGAGAGGLVSAYIAAAVRAKVTLVESHKMGGDCLHHGCVPSKALIRAAKAMQQVRTAQYFGLRGAQAEVDFAAVMQRVREVIRQIEPHDSIERYTDLGVQVLQGHAHITSPWTVQVRQLDGTVQTLSTRNIVIAAGASPVVPGLPGLQEAGFLTSDTVWDLSELPQRLVVLGGGPVGCELAQSFARLGSQVWQVEHAERLLPREDTEVSELVARSLRADGVQVLTGHEALRVEFVQGVKQLIVRHGAQEQAIAFDRLLCAVGRQARVEGYGLEALGMAPAPGQTLQTNAWQQTLYPNIYAVGDVAGPLQFTHVAAHQAWYAVVNALFGRFRRFKVDQAVIPRATFTDPEVARVGLSEAEARAQGVAFEVTRYDIDDLDRAIVDGVARGFVKVLTVPGRDRILGVTIVGEHAAELLAEYVLAMKHGLGLNRILGTVHSYPTLAEANKYAAGQWKRAHAPQRLLAWVQRFHAWERR